MERFTFEQIQQFMHVAKETICSVDNMEMRDSGKFWDDVDTISSMTISTTTTTTRPTTRTAVN